MANKGNSFLALITGAAIGTAVGLLYAPESGERTREKLSKDAKKAQEKLNKKYHETASNLTSKAKQAKEEFETRLEETLSSASYKADEILAAMESKLEELRKQNSKLQRDVKDDLSVDDITTTTPGAAAGSTPGTTKSNKAVI